MQNEIIDAAGGMLSNSIKYSSFRTTLYFRDIGVFNDYLNAYTSEYQRMVDECKERLDRDNIPYDINFADKHADMQDLMLKMSFKTVKRYSSSDILCKYLMEHNMVNTQIHIHANHPHFFNKVLDKNLIDPVVLSAIKLTK